MSPPSSEPPQKGSKVIWLDNTENGWARPAQERVLSIGNVARMFGVTRLALRYYEFRGLIRRRQVMEGQRVYGWADCDRIAFIIKCRRAGVPLRELIAIISASDEDATPEAVKQGQERCMALVDRLERKRKHFDEALAELNHVYTLLTSRLLGPDGSDDKP
jgi:DNA-binding transcriptional MerR regulator